MTAGGVRHGRETTTYPPMATPLYLSRDADYDWLTALPLGRVSDGQPEENYLHLGDSFRWCLDGPAGDVMGFEVVVLREFDADAPEYAEAWDGQRFDAPLLALTKATAAEIVVAAQGRYRDESTLNRIYFDRAVGLEGEEAVEQWRLCLECGDSMAHYGLGYTLLHLGRAIEAYAHLRHYADLVPTNAWAWCYLGRACAALGVDDEARAAYRRAIALGEAGGFETDAPELLAALDQPQRRRGG
jgi:tetratricopeptide (TPR) repeat protein